MFVCMHVHVCIRTYVISFPGTSDSLLSIHVPVDLRCACVHVCMYIHVYIVIFICTDVAVCTYV